MGKGLTVRAAVANILGKGFKESRESGHRYFVFVYNGKTTHINTHFSHGSNEDIGDELLSRIKRQLKLDTANEVASFLRCDMSEVDYQQKLLAKKLI